MIFFGPKYIEFSPPLVNKNLIEVVRCKNCKHRPKEPDCTEIGGLGIKFPDSRCPCQCGDGYYSWYPDDDWFCGNGERRDNDATD